MTDRRKRVLVVDDSELLLDVARLHLEELGLAVSTALDLDAMRRQMEIESPDLIICDVTMLGSTDQQLGETIRAVEVPVWLFSGVEVSALADRAESWGASAYIPKGDGLETLTRLVSEHFAKDS